jgi:phosphoribosylamine--glycine ligase
MRATVRELKKRFGYAYAGALYGQFMLTRDGPKLIEYNARFGDPEAINALSVLETDLVEICRAITNGTLDRLPVSFQSSATVVKYVAPINYCLPKDQRVVVKSDLIQIGDLGKARLYHASIHGDATGYHLTSSRAVAILGLSPDLAEAEKIAERGACAITGAVAHRRDIGTAELIAQRVRHMEELRRTN